MGISKADYSLTVTQDLSDHDEINPLLFYRGDYIKGVCILPCLNCLNCQICPQREVIRGAKRWEPSLAGTKEPTILLHVFSIIQPNSELLSK